MGDIAGKFLKMLRSVPQRVQELEGYRDVDSLWDVAGKFCKNTRKLPEPCHDIGGLQGRRILGLALLRGPRALITCYIRDITYIFGHYSIK